MGGKKEKRDVSLSGWMDGWIPAQAHCKLTEREGERYHILNHHLPTTHHHPEIILLEIESLFPHLHTYCTAG